ncbi:MAG: terminase family protein [Bacteroidetes bacterium]|nr:terminase family protein [Bacteroidota bacterium]
MTKLQLKKNSRSSQKKSYGQEELFEEIDSAEEICDKDSEIDWEAAKKKFLPHQIEFAELSPMEIKHPALVGGFGCGKTTAVALRWLKLIDFRIEQKKECEIMILEPTREMINDIIVPSFDEIFETLGIKTKYARASGIYSIFYRGKNRFAKFRSANNPNSLTGKNLTDFIIDEFDKIPAYKQKVLWRECVSRIRKAKYGTGAVVTTPEGFKMTHYLWVEKVNSNFKLLKAKTGDNIYLPDDYIANLYEQFDSRLVKQYIEGEFVNIESELAYYCFHREKCVVKDDSGDAMRGDDERIVISFDFNVNPICAAEIIYIGKVRYQIYEYKISNSSTRELCETIITSLERRFGECADNLSLFITGDASGNTRSTIGDSTDYAIIKRAFEEAGFSTYFFIKGANPPVRERVNFVNSLFEKEQFYILSNCKNSIKDRELVSWKKGSEKFVIDKSDRNATHLSDAVDYGLWATRKLISENDEKSSSSIIREGRRYI